MNPWKSTLLVIAIWAAAGSSGNAQSYTVTTFAGPTLVTNGALATTQSINASSVAADSSGGFYFADSAGHRIYRVSADGRIRIVAGDGTAGFAGDGGPAVSAKLRSPRGLAVDRAGNLFIADFENWRVRKVSTTGVITTIAGNGNMGAEGDGGPATAAGVFLSGEIAVDVSGNVFIGTGGNTVRRVNPAGIISTAAGQLLRPGQSGDGGPATAAQLSVPQALAVDAAGNLLIVDGGNNRRIRKIATDGIISTLAGTTNLKYPSAIAVNTAGEIFIGDGALIRKVNRDGTITTVADLGTGAFTPQGATAAPLQGLAVDSGANLIVAAGTRIFSITATGSVRVVAGNGENPGFSPFRIVADGVGNIYVSDNFIPRVQRITGNGVKSTLVNEASGIVGLAADRTGNVFISASFGGIRKITPSGAVQTIIAPSTMPAADQLAPVALTVDNGGTLYVADGGRGIRKVSQNGVISNFVQWDPLSNRGIAAIAADSAGNVYASVGGQPGGTIRKYTPAGVETTAVDLSPLAVNAGDIAVDAAGNVYFTTRQRVCKVTPAGLVSGVTEVDSTGAYAGSRLGVAVDPAGNVFISTHDRILKATAEAPASPSPPCGNGKAPSYTISTYAGGPPPIPARGTLAVAQPVAAPHAVAAGPNGDFYVVSREENRVYRVDRNGTVSVVAGTGVAGFRGDGGPATAAEVNSPGGITVDAAGNLYIADSVNYRVRKINPAGVITTVAGNGMPGTAGDGGPATTARLAFPTSVAVDWTGNLFIGTGSVVRKVSPTGVITTIAGLSPEIAEQRVIEALAAVQRGGADANAVALALNPGLGDGGPATAATLRGTVSLAVDSSGNLYISDSPNNRVRKVTAATGIITTAAGGASGVVSGTGDGGPATAASLGNPQGIAVDAIGNLFINDFLGRRVRKVNTGGIISTVAGNGGYGFGGDGGPANAASMAPQGIAVDGSGNLYIADSENQRVRRVTPAGVISTVMGNGVAHFSGDGGPAVAAELSWLEDIAVDMSGNLFIADRENARVRKVNSSGLITTMAGSGQPERSPAEPQITGDGGPATSARLAGPGGVAADAAGNLYISAQYGTGVRRVSSNGTITTVPGTAGLRTERIAVDASGNLFVSAGMFDSRVLRITPSGIVSTVAGSGNPGFSGDGGPAAAAQLNTPKGIAVDAAGNLFIADSGNARIRKVSPTGIITTVAGGGAFGDIENGQSALTAYLDRAEAIAIDGAGNLFIAGFQVRQITPDGKIWLIAGAGGNGFSGDGGPAVKATLGASRGIAVDRTGNIFVADASGRVRKLTPEANPTVK